GEKHVTPSHLGNTSYDIPMAPGLLTNNSGGTRILSLGLAQRPDSPTPTSTALATDNGNYRYGSWHPGVTQFVFGDARVQAVKNYMSNVATSGTVSPLEAMGGRDDGTPYDTP